MHDMQIPEAEQLLPPYPMHDMQIPGAENLRGRGAPTRMNQPAFVPKQNRTTDGGGMFCLKIYAAEEPPQE
jgi:hypothetical protein